MSSLLSLLAPGTARAQGPAERVAILALGIAVGLGLTAIAFGRTEPVAPQAELAYQLQRDDWQATDGLSLIVRHVG